MVAATRFASPNRWKHGHRLRIEAEGYAPAISRLIADRAGDVTIDFELVAGQSITGVVRLPGGRPVDGCGRGAGCPVDNRPSSTTAGRRAVVTIAW